MSKGIIDKLELPKEVICSMPTIYIKGNIEMLIENHRGINQYDEHRIQVMTLNQSIIINGDSLCITEFDHNIIKLSGRIKEVVFK